MLPPKVTAQAPALAVELVTAALILHRDGDRAPTDATVAGVNDIPLMPEQRSELVGLIVEQLLSTVVALLDAVAQQSGTTAEAVWQAIAGELAAISP